MNNCAQPPRPRSLSIVLPVHNAERTLTTRVIELLEVLPDLVDGFEVMIVDDGSTDQTDEMAADLARCYPQVKFARHSEPQGIEASARTGIERTSGEVVIVHAGTQPVSAHELERMWQTREDEQLVVSQCDGQPGPVSDDVIEQLTDWGRRLASGDDAQVHEARVHDAHVDDEPTRRGPRRPARSAQQSNGVPAPNFGFATGHPSERPRR